VNVSPGIHAWELEKYHVPLVLHHAQYFPTATVDTRMAGHLDVMTTAASLAGVDHVNTTLGRNLFDRFFDKERYSFVYNYYSELNEYGLLSEKFYLHYDDKNSFQLFAYHSETPQVDVQTENPDVFLRMKTIAEGYLQTGRYLLFHNQKKGAGRNQPPK
jgi:arylsulfatase A-like enzyme